jgi:heme/copper-type cytochrome/quinol oxidase subunit 1
MKFFSFFFKQCFWSTNHKDRVSLSLIFGILSGIIGTLFSVLIIIRLYLPFPGNQIFGGNYQLYYVIVKAHVFLMPLIIIIVLLLLTVKNLKKIGSFNSPLKFFFKVFMTVLLITLKRILLHLVSIISRILFSCFCFCWKFWCIFKPFKEGASKKIFIDLKF